MKQCLANLNSIKVKQRRSRSVSSLIRNIKEKFQAQLANILKNVKPTLPNLFLLYDKYIVYLLLL